MSVSKKLPIVGQTEGVFVSPCNGSVYDDKSVSRVLAELAQQISSMVSPATQSANPTSGMFEHLHL